MTDMTRDEFWTTIEQARHSVGRTSDVPSWLEEKLSQWPENEIVDFGAHFEDCRGAAYDARLWLAADVILGGCSDDSFDYFRGWLISQGRKVYEAALADPDSLADVECLGGDDGYPRLERMLSVIAARIVSGPVGIVTTLRLCSATRLYARAGPLLR